MFSLSNEDVIILYKGIKFSAITDVCQKIERLMLSRTKMMGLNPYREESLYSIMELSLNFVNVMRFIEGLDTSGSPDGGKVKTKPAVTWKRWPGSKARWRSSICHLSCSTSRSWISGGSGESAGIFRALYLRKERRGKDQSGVRMTANRWLFNYFTSNLDQSILKTLNYGIDLAIHQF